jgi:hypothetical protein
MAAAEGDAMRRSRYRWCLIAIVALPLSACIVSDYDVSADLKPVFPIEPATYTAGADKVYVVRREKDEYAVTNPNDSDVIYIRLFKIPEYTGYILDMYERGKPSHQYMFLKTTEKGFDIYDFDKLPDHLPPNVVKLVNPIEKDDRTYNIVTVTNGKRDTLTVIRELIGAKLEMSISDKNSYQRQP